MIKDEHKDKIKVYKSYNLLIIFYFSIFSISLSYLTYHIFIISFYVLMVNF